MESMDEKLDRFIAERQAAYHIKAAEMSLNAAKLLSECRRQVTALSEGHLAKADEYLAKLD